MFQTRTPAVRCFKLRPAGAYKRLYNSDDDRSKHFIRIYSVDHDLGQDNFERASILE